MRKNHPYIKSLSVLTVLSLCLISTVRASDETWRPTDSKVVMPYLNSGPSPLQKGLNKFLNPEKDYITWMIEAPKVTMDMRSAEMFRRSFATNQSDSEGISHMMVLWQCHDDNGKIFHGGTSMTGENEDQSKKMLVSGWGMTTFIANFTDGELTDPSELDEYLEDSKEKKIQVAPITFEVKRENCKNMLTFIQKFIDHPNHPATRFGGANARPLKFQGGGCGSFASALVQTAGIMPSIHQYFWRRLTASQYLMGFDQDLPTHTEVNLPKAFQNKKETYIWRGKMQMEPWTTEDGPSVEMVDPELGLLVFRTIAKEYVKISKKDVGLLKGTGFEPRVIKSSTWGDTSNTSGYTTTLIPITEKYDEHDGGQAALITKQTRQELKKMLDSSMTISTASIGGFWGLLISQPK